MARFITMVLLTYAFFMGCALFIVEEPTIEEKIQFTVEENLMFPYHTNAKLLEQFESKNQNWFKEFMSE